MPGGRFPIVQYSALSQAHGNNWELLPIEYMNLRFIFGLLFLTFAPSMRTSLNTSFKSLSRIHVCCNGPRHLLPDAEMVCFLSYYRDCEYIVVNVYVADE